MILEPIRTALMHLRALDKPKHQQCSVFLGLQLVQKLSLFLPFYFELHNALSDTNQNSDGCWSESSTDLCQFVKSQFTTQYDFLRTSQRCFQRCQHPPPSPPPRLALIGGSDTGMVDCPERTFRSFHKHLLEPALGPESEVQRPAGSRRASLALRQSR